MRTRAVRGHSQVTEGLRGLGGVQRSQGQRKAEQMRSHVAILKQLPTQAATQVVKTEAQTLKKLNQIGLRGGGDKPSTLGFSNELDSVSILKPTQQIDCVSNIPTTSHFCLFGSRMPSVIASERMPSVIVSERMPSVIVSERMPSVIVSERMPSVIVSERMPSVIVSERMPSVIVSERMPSVIVSERMPSVIVSERMPSVIVSETHTATY
ncbi:hypothetical protein EGW08_007878 [Elysia chlorotica]|uniref:Uncharacterized protein n=1 Tax=Elysia chlorotica TaxID=188477 RepID=A0A3S0ZQC6_ELYCH|nr:hypothetical protein EGW08_007878 [Elysia chlorotica]